MCSSLKSFSKDLCNALAALTRRLCTEFVYPSSTAAFFACRLTPLNKNPGVRPIGACERVRRIIGKAVISTLQYEIQSVAGAMQLCAGQKAGCEAAITPCVPSLQTLTQMVFYWLMQPMRSTA